ncbi:hypothetical protein J7L13_00785, partial [bacterium]|nr:hypothetical protein [bacterium]
MDRQNPKVGIWVLIGKMGAKVSKPLVKLFSSLLKGGKAIKAGMAAGAFASWAWLFNWKFALLLLAFISVHEYGHVWGM